MSALTGAETVRFETAPTTEHPAGTSGLVALADIAKLGVGRARGTVTLQGATPVEVAYPAMAVDTIVVFSLSLAGGSPETPPAITALEPGVGFKVAGNAADMSTYNWAVL